MPILQPPPVPYTYITPLPQEQICASESPTSTFPKLEPFVFIFPVSGYFASKLSGVILSASSITIQIPPKQLVIVTCCMLHKITLLLNTHTHTHMYTHTHPHMTELWKEKSVGKHLSPVCLCSLKKCKDTVSFLLPPPNPTPHYISVAIYFR